MGDQSQLPVRELDPAIVQSEAEQLIETIGGNAGDLGSDVTIGDDHLGSNLRRLMGTISEEPMLQVATIGVIAGVILIGGYFVNRFIRSRRKPVKQTPAEPFGEDLV